MCNVRSRPGLRESGILNHSLSNATRCIALVAGEDSGDQLGAELARALSTRLPGVRLVGVGGPRMRAAGVDTWIDIAELSVMGIAEVLRHLPRLLRLRRSLAQRLQQELPDVVVGIDAPDFNLGLERRLKQAGIPTVHYVSPSIWAWREGRAAKLGASANRVLCLFPMEPPIYALHGVEARFVGHPLADRFALHPDRLAARRELGIADDARVLAVLPGSRSGEIARLGGIFLDAATRVAQAVPEMEILLPAANTHCMASLRNLLASRVPGSACFRLLDGQAHTALLAADVALVASGTAALETMLAKTPMVVGYRIAPLTYRLVHALNLMKTRVYSLPNVLAGRTLVPELMQDECRADTLATALIDLIGDASRRAAMVAEFTRLHAELHGPGDGTTAAAHAADAIVELLEHHDAA